MQTGTCAVVDDSTIRRPGGGRGPDKNGAQGSRRLDPDIRPLLSTENFWVSEEPAFLGDQQHCAWSGLSFGVNDHEQSMHLLVILADAGIHLSCGFGEVFGWTPAWREGDGIGKGSPQSYPGQ